MIRNKLFAASLCIALAGCATDPEQFSNSVNNAVDNVQTAAVASVSIGTSILRAVVSLAPAVLDALAAL